MNVNLPGNLQWKGTPKKDLQDKMVKGKIKDATTKT